MSFDEPLTFRINQGNLKALDGATIGAVFVTGDFPQPTRAMAHVDEVALFEVDVADAPGYVRPTFLVQYVTGLGDDGEADGLVLVEGEAPTADTSGAASVAGCVFYVHQAATADADLELLSALPSVEHPGMAEDDIVFPATGLAIVRPPGAGDGVLEVVAGSNVTVDSSDSLRPVVSATASGGGASGAVTIDPTEETPPTITADLSDVDPSVAAVFVQLPDAPCDVTVIPPSGDRGELGLVLLAGSGGEGNALTLTVTGTDYELHSAGILSTVLTPLPDGLGASMVIGTLTTADGTGDVVGPGSSVDGHLAAFDGTTGDLLRDGGVAVSDLVASSEKGVALGVADLDAGGLIPSALLPSYVDDVLSYANLAAFPGTGATGKIYVAEDTNLTYRWSGSAYVEISASLALGSTSSTAHRGDQGATAYTHSQITTGNPHGTTAADVGSPPTSRTIAGLDLSADRSAAALKTALSLAKADVGLGNVDNTSDATKALLVANNQTGTTYTLALGDAGKVIEANNASAITLTIPTNASVAFPIGTIVEVFQMGAGQVTISGAGVTIRAPRGAKTGAQYAVASLWKRDTDTWVISGDVTT